MGRNKWIDLIIGLNGLVCHLGVGYFYGWKLAGMLFIMLWANNYMLKRYFDKLNP